jgi:translation initiation factor 2 beta subunit (eIF-2beta)/eIF-5
MTPFRGHSIPIVGTASHLTQDNDDPNYRYQMPALQTTTLRSNKTVVLNMVDVGRSLYRSPAEMTKFVSLDLGTTARFDVTHGTTLVNGTHSRDTLQACLHRYIERFVVCAAPVACPRWITR